MKWSPLLILLLAIAGTTKAAPTDSPGTQEDFIRWAKTKAVATQAAELDDDFSDLAPLKAMIGTARVVALGEPSHGAHEPLAFRNRLFRYLVQDLGFTAIAIESGFPESKGIYDYVAGGDGNAEKIVHDDLTWGLGGFQENVDLVRWLRDYNSAKVGHPGMVRFYGIDLSLGGPFASTPTRAALDRALAYLGRVDSASAARMHGKFEPFLARLPVGTFTPGERDGLSAAIAELVALFERERPAYIAFSSKEDYEWGYHDAVVARQADDEFREEPRGQTGGGIPPGAWRLMNARNAAMAENVRWILEHEGPKGRVLVFAHNAHVINARTEAGAWAALERPPNAMGQYLRSMLADDLLIIGASAGHYKGGPSALPIPGSIDAALAQVGIPQFIVDLRLARTAPAAHGWLTERHVLHTNDMASLTLTPATAFDLLVYIDTATPAHRVASPRNE